MLSIHFPDTDDKFETCPKKPAAGRRKRRQPAGKVPASDSTDDDDDDGFSSTNTAASSRSRSKSVDKEKRTRGRPKKNPQAAPATVITPPKTTPKKETTKKAARARSIRQNSNVKSREFVATESSSDEESTPTKKATTPSNNLRLPIVSPRAQALATAQQQLQSPTRAAAAAAAVAASAAAAATLNQPTLRSATNQAGKSRTTNSKLSLLSESDENSDSSDGGSDEHMNSKPISDKNKNVTLRKLFWTSKGDSGAKGKGQVVIVDGSEDAQQQLQQQQQQQITQPTQTRENVVPTEKLLSPYNSNKQHAKLTTASSIPSSNSYNNNNNNNLLLKCPSAAELIALSNKTTTNPSSMAVMCRIDLSRLSRIPPRRRNSGHRSKYEGSRQSRATHIEEDGSRLSNSRDSSTSSSSTDSLQRNAENGSNSSRHRFEYDTSMAVSVNDRGKHSGSSSGYNSIDSRLSHGDAQSLRNQTHSPKLDERLIGRTSIKTESLKNEFSNSDYTYCNMISPLLKGVDDKHSNSHSQSNQSCKGYGSSNENIKRETMKMEPAFGDSHQNTDARKLSVSPLPNSRKKRTSSANSSPYKDKKRKKQDLQNDMQTGPPTNHDRFGDSKHSSSNKPQQKIYYSYFERSIEERDEIRYIKK